MLLCRFPRKQGHTEPQIPHAEHMPCRQTGPVLFLHGVGSYMSSRVMLTHLSAPHTQDHRSTKVVQTYYINHRCHGPNPRQPVPILN